MSIEVYTDLSVANDSRAPSCTIPTLVTNDVVAVVGFTWDSPVTLANPSGTGLNFGSINGGAPWVLNPGTGSRSFLAIWAMQATAGGSSIAVSTTVSGSSMHGILVYRLPAADGYSLAATPNKLAPTSVAQSGSLTGATNNIGIVAVADWNGGTGSRTWIGSNTEDAYTASSGNNTWYNSHYTLTGASTSVGLSAPASMSQANIGALEILWTNPGPVQYNGLITEDNKAIQLESGLWVATE